MIVRHAILVEAAPYAMHLRTGLSILPHRDASLCQGTTMLGLPSLLHVKWAARFVPPRPTASPVMPIFPCQGVSAMEAAR